jgi:hypothetical protein
VCADRLQTRCRATPVPQARVTDGQPGLLLTTAGRWSRPRPGHHLRVPKLMTNPATAPGHRRAVSGKIIGALAAVWRLGTGRPIANWIARAPFISTLVSQVYPSARFDYLPDPSDRSARPGRRLPWRSASPGRVPITPGRRISSRLTPHARCTAQHHDPRVAGAESWPLIRRPSTLGLARTATPRSCRLHAIRRW